VNPGGRLAPQLDSEACSRTRARMGGFGWNDVVTSTGGDRVHERERAELGTTSDVRDVPEGWR